VGRTLQLYQLQSLDSKIDDANQKLVDIAAKLSENQALVKARTAAEAAEQNLRKAQAAMQDLDLEVKSLADKISNEEKVLYSGKVLNAKEAANLQDEVASLKRRHAELEERLLEAMLEVEDAETSLNGRREEFVQTEANWTSNQEVLHQTQTEVETTLGELQERRPAVTGTIDNEELEKYESLRARKAGRAVVLVKAGVCQGCGMTLSNSRVQRARAEVGLTYCSTCGRILYVP
jgi:predicted  nucleic acid-binding Zn-ribbon protein